MDNNGYQLLVGDKAIYTPCTLHLELIYQCKTGKGMVSFEREYDWPGMPTVGMTLSSGEVPYLIGGEMTVDTISLELDEKPPRLWVSMKEYDLGHHAYLAEKRGDNVGTGKEFFLGQVYHMADAGWDAKYGNWWPSGPCEDLRNELIGIMKDVLEEDEEDDNEIEEEEEDDEDDD